MRTPPHIEPVVIGYAVDAIARAKNRELTDDEISADRTPQVRPLLMIIIALPVAISIGVPLLLWLAS